MGRSAFASARRIGHSVRFSSGSFTIRAAMKPAGLQRPRYLETFTVVA
jgi:hypothetical protein